MLNDAGMEAPSLNVDRPALNVKTAIAHAVVAFHHAAQAGDGEAAFPAFDLLLPGSTSITGLMSTGGEARPGPRVAGVVAETKDDELQNRRRSAERRDRRR